MQFTFYMLVFTLAALAVSLVVVYVLMLRAKQQRKNFEIQRIVNYISTSLIAFNNEEEVYWDVVRNCIANLHFENCTIYSLDASGKKLMQRAAFGPNGKEFDSTEIPVSGTLAESVAISGKADVVADTSQDHRYVINDASRNSELAIPIIDNGKVIAVISSAHSKKNFFSDYHLQILSPVAATCALKITKVRDDEFKASKARAMEIDKKLAITELKAVRSQVNSHFIFNTLNLINSYILLGDSDRASESLLTFSKWLRMTFDNSASGYVYLENELLVLKLYIQLESSRFEGRFRYSITVAPDINTRNIKIPSMTIQPYVENAIWHGLLNKTDIGMLRVIFTLEDTETLVCRVIDDGVGRAKTIGLQKHIIKSTTLGTRVVEERLQLLEEETSIEIIDDYAASGEPSGTQVIIRFKIR